MSTKITKIEGEEILDSRGKPTMQVTIHAGSDSESFAVPSGASTGSSEAHELDIKEALEKLDKEISPALLGMNVTKQEKIDRTLIELDGTPNKSRIGGNTMVGVSIACAKTAAKSFGQETYEYLPTLKRIKPSRKVPYLYMNLVEGGQHTKTNLAFQEYILVPTVETISEALELEKEIETALEEIIKKQFELEYAQRGDEGGFAPDIESVEKPLELLAEALEKTGNSNKAKLALDVAASSFYSDSSYKIAGQVKTKNEMIALYGELAKKFPILSIEDPLFEEDFDGFGKVLSQNPNLMIVGDDLTTTNPERLKRAIDKKSINAIIIKPNQIGTLTETLETMALARENNIDCIVSHRSGETNDDFIADLAYAFGCFGLKAGAPSQKERAVKYNRLKKITSV